jgi:uncharacterized RDD family membrane protein YckC
MTDSTAASPPESTASAVLPPAALWRRLAAIFYDFFLVFAIWIVVGFLVMAALGIDKVQAEQGLAPLHQTLLFAGEILSAILFFGWFWTHSGQTIGMQAWRIKVESRDGAPLSWKQVLQRLAVAPFALALGGIGYWWCLFDAGKRSWPDLVSGSRVVKCPDLK